MCCFGLALKLERRQHIQSHFTRRRLRQIHHRSHHSFRRSQPKSQCGQRSPTTPTREGYPSGVLHQVRTQSCHCGISTARQCPYRPAQKPSTTRNTHRTIQRRYTHSHQLCWSKTEAIQHRDGTRRRKIKKPCLSCWSPNTTSTSSICSTTPTEL